MTPVKLHATIYQGATFRLDLERVSYPYVVTVGADGVIRKADGSPAPDTDRVEESYENSIARMQIRPSIDSTEIIADLTSVNGGIELGGRRLSIVIGDDDTSAMQPWTGNYIGHVEVERQSGVVERQYEITFDFSPEVTR